MQRYSKMVVALMVAGLAVGCSRGKSDGASPEQSATDRAIEKAVAKANEGLPKVINGIMKLERVEYANRVVRYSGALMDNKKLTPEQTAKFEKTMIDTYCNGSMKRFAEAKVSLEYVMTTDSKEQPWVTKFSPDKCGS